MTAGAPVWAEAQHQHGHLPLLPLLPLVTLPAALLPQPPPAGPMLLLAVVHCFFRRRLHAAEGSGWCIVGLRVC
jgi:hypothetical protein